MENKPYWEANSHSTSQEFPFFMELGVSLPCWGESDTGPYTLKLFPKQ